MDGLYQQHRRVQGRTGHSGHRAFPGWAARVGAGFGPLGGHFRNKSVPRAATFLPPGPAELFARAGFNSQSCLGRASPSLCLPRGVALLRTLEHSEKDTWPYHLKRKSPFPHDTNYRERPLRVLCHPRGRAYSNDSGAVRRGAVCFRCCHSQINPPRHTVKPPRIVSPTRECHTVAPVKGWFVHINTSTFKEMALPILYT